VVTVTPRARLAFPLPAGLVWAKQGGFGCR
jgi:hypothetical protein